MKRIALVAAMASIALNAYAESLMDAQDKYRGVYKDCDSFEGRLLSATDLDGDESDETVMHYSFVDCKGAYKTGTHVVVFYKSGGKWATAKGDSVLSATEAKMYSLESAEGGVLVLKNVMQDDEAPIRLKYAKGQVKRVK
jgi:hypothetical protein